MNFYQKLPSFGDFSEITMDSHFAEVPGDWQVLIADIMDSTRAVEEGRYKDVNTLGAATIVAAHSQMENDSFPFVFGGDGSSMVIPPHKLEAVGKELRVLRLLARDHFSMNLRIGVVPVAHLHGARMEVAKLRIAGSRTLAVFRGGGLSLAEFMIKQDGNPYLLGDDASDAGEVELGPLSCRWLPIPASRDHVMALLVRSRAGAEAYQKVLSGISLLYDGRLDHANPIHTGGARYRSFKQCLSDEKRYHRTRWSFRYLRRVMEISVAVLIFRHGLPGLIKAPAYVGSMGLHSDYRKFDDMLRMVIDCSKFQAEQIASLLQDMQEKGEIDYGLHLSKESLITCFFQSPGEGGHLHFVDGGDGGYVMAAKQLKRQMSDASDKRG